MSRVGGGGTRCVGALYPERTNRQTAREASVQGFCVRSTLVPVGSRSPTPSHSSLTLYRPVFHTLSAARQGVRKGVGVRVMSWRC